MADLYSALLYAICYTFNYLLRNINIWKLTKSEMILYENSFIHSPSTSLSFSLSLCYNLSFVAIGYN